jgi:hypothetical protein
MVLDWRKRDSIVVTCGSRTIFGCCNGRQAVCPEEKGVKKGKDDSNVSDHLHADQDRELSGNT